MTDFLETLWLKNARLRLVVALAVCAYPVYNFLVYAWQVPAHRVIDLFVRYVAAALLASHGNLYALGAQKAMALQIGGVNFGTAFSSVLLGYTHPPSDAFFDLRYLPFPFPLARWAFAAESVVLFALTLIFLWSALRVMSPHSLHWVFPVALFALFGPARSSMGIGQSDIAILFLSVLAFWAFNRDHDLVAGIAIAIATLMKLTPALFLIYFVWKREWRVVAYAAATGAVILLLSLPVIGVGTWLEFVTRVFPAISTGTAYTDNQSLPGLINRLVLDPRFMQGLRSAPSVPILRAINTGAELLIVALALVLSRGQPASRGSLRFALEFSLFLIIQPIISPIAWDHYFTWLLMPIVVLLAVVANSRAGAASRAVMLSALAAGTWLANIPVAQFDAFPGESPLLYGALVILVLLAEGLMDARVNEAAESESASESVRPVLA